MKKSARFMILGIGLILAGILAGNLSVLFRDDLTSNLYWLYLEQLLPLSSVVIGPVLLVIGFFIKDEK
ncbi:MAG: hypothetical protein V8S82_04970 [Eubacteriales bacterium]|jgi:ABC-type transporter Mla maintaining outer membrane lipid asymmetry permease subunit MlaE